MVLCWLVQCFNRNRQILNLIYRLFDISKMSFQLFVKIRGNRFGFESEIVISNRIKPPTDQKSPIKSMGQNSMIRLHLLYGIANIFIVLVFTWKIIRDMRTPSVSMWLKKGSLRRSSSMSIGFLDDFYLIFAFWPELHSNLRAWLARSNFYLMVLCFLCQSSCTCLYTSYFAPS